MKTRMVPTVSCFSANTKYIHTFIVFLILCKTQPDMTLHRLPPAVPGGEVATCSGEAGCEGESSRLAACLLV